MEERPWQRDYFNQPILQYTEYGVLIKEWHSAAQAARELGINYNKIIMCTNGRKQTYLGYIWRKSSEPIEHKTHSVF